MVDRSALTLRNLAFAHVLAGVRDEHARDLAEIRRELEQLRGQLDTVRKLDGLEQRLADLEVRGVSTSRGPVPLRALDRGRQGGDSEAMFG